MLNSCYQIVKIGEYSGARWHVAEAAASACLMGGSADATIGYVYF